MVLAVEKVGVVGKVCSSAANNKSVIYRRQSWLGFQLSHPQGGGMQTNPAWLPESPLSRGGLYLEGGPEGGPEQEKGHNMLIAMQS